MPSRRIRLAPPVPVRGLRPAAALVALLAGLALPLAGCGGGTRTTILHRTVTQGGEDTPGGLGFPASATRNTVRVGGADAITDAAAVAELTHPGQTPKTRLSTVALADARDWQSALAASVLVHPPIGAPILLSDGTSLPSATTDALAFLKPRGGGKGRPQVIRVGQAPAPEGLTSTQISATDTAADPAALAAAVARFRARAAGNMASAVMIVSAQAPAYAMPAAGWAAESGDPILFVDHDAVPAATAAALKHGHAHLYVLGPPSVISEKVTRRLGHYGAVTRIAGGDPAANAIAFARYRAGGFGWGVTQPGHGLVFLRGDRPADAAAAAPLSATGDYGPLLVLDHAAPLPRSVLGYLLSVQPGYRGDPTRAVYNHGWLMGDTDAIALATQAQIDRLLEVAPVNATPPRPAPSQPSTPTTTTPTTTTPTTTAPTSTAPRPARTTTAPVLAPPTGASPHPASPTATPTP